MAVAHPPTPPIHDAALLDLCDVSKSFGSVQALDTTSLSVSRGEFVSVIGPSGCGKSTLLRLVAQLETPTSGELTVRTDHTGYVFQDATLLPWRNVHRNVELLGELAGMESGRLRTATDDAISTVGLAEFGQHLPHQLSGGMRMRASLARALVLNPELFLFDEPFGSLDQITREQLNLVLQDLFVRSSFAALFVTHSVAESVFLSTRVVVLSARPGRIVADVEVPFAYPRSLDLRYSSSFARVSGAVASALEGAL